MSILTIYGPQPSSYVRTARMTCIEKGVEHELQPIELGGEPHHRLHPWGKVPILEHGSVRLFETSAICRYIDDTFGGPALTPRDATGRAVMEQWISALNCYFYDDLIRSFALQYIFPRGADGAPNREVIDRAVPLMHRDLDALEKGLSGNAWLAGETFSLADAFYAPVLFTASLFPEGQQAIASRSNVQRYLERLIDRPSFRKVQPK
jgi:glutathione S-transferase